MNPSDDIKNFIQSEAQALGFDKIGFAKANRTEEAEHLRQWLDLSYHGTMTWMENYFEKRIDPRVLFPGAKTVIVVALNYHQPSARHLANDTAKISQYAWGDDYHDVLKDKLFSLLDSLRVRNSAVEGKVCVDTAPMMDKYWAVQAGIGWQGKHSNVIAREWGSWFFIGSLVVNLEIAPDAPGVDFCGTCNRCIEACPTRAITQPYVVDANRCISYYTIEYRSETFPASIASNLQNWIYGCDICQDVCPWNIKFAKPTRELRFAPRMDNVLRPLKEWMTLTEEEFKLRFKKSAVKRTKFSGFYRNVRLAVQDKKY